MPRSTDDFIREREFTSVADLRRRIPKASPALVNSLEQFLARQERATTVKVVRQKTKKRRFKRLKGSYIYRLGQRVHVYRDKRGRFTSITSKAARL